MRDSFRSSSRAGVLLGTAFLAVLVIVLSRGVATDRLR